MGWHAGRGGWQAASWQAGWAGGGSSSDSWAAHGGGGDAAELVPASGGDEGDAARSQRKGKGKVKRPVNHTNHVPLPPQTTAARMRMGQSYLASGQSHLTPEQLILQIADGDWRGMATWWDAPQPLQIAFRHVLEDGHTEFEFEHQYAGAQMCYCINFDTMTSTNPDSGTVRAIRISAAVMW
jgi:hypothetical protein